LANLRAVGDLAEGDAALFPGLPQLGSNRHGWIGEPSGGILHSDLPFADELVAARRTR
jgi:hypothetical protein